MDWIEKVFGFSPDGGSGLTEFLLLLVPILMAVGVIVAVRMHRQSKTSKQRRQTAAG
jgi:hypothetical protein